MADKFFVLKCDGLSEKKASKLVKDVMDSKSKNAPNSRGTLVWGDDKKFLAKK